MIGVSQELGRRIISADDCSPIFPPNQYLCKAIESINVSHGSLLSHRQERVSSHCFRVVKAEVRMEGKENMRLMPILVGVGVVAASAILAKIILDQRKKVD